MKRNKLFILVCLMAVSASAQQQKTELAEGWQFSRDKQTWQSVTVPHDWAISGPFDRNNDLQTVAIIEDGDTKAVEMPGRTGSLPWVGEGHYKRMLHIPEGIRYAELVFDGAMAEPTISINGKRAGYWAYGYNAFRVDITAFVHQGDNLLEVDLNNVENSARWYPGGGIYRPVTLVLSTDKARIDYWGTYIRTLFIDPTKATLCVSSQCRDIDTDDILEVAVCDAEGNNIASKRLGIDGNGKTETTFDIENPRLWSPETPYLYQVVTRLYRNHRLVDEAIDKTGIRMVKVSKENGFQLNGQTRKIKGVCLHHDLGPLGAAVNKTALIRQIKMMKEMGADAIRTSHNPPSTWQMEVCDSLGMMVMAEAFDMWLYPKCKNGYVRFFREWSDRDLNNLILNHRNHPSIVMWSIGNEIRDQATPKGVETMRHLQGICHSLDPLRPVTCGINRHETAFNSGFVQQLEVPGFNYGLGHYAKNIKRLPQGFCLGAETASTVSSRGVYKFPVEPTTQINHPDGQCSNYDVEYCPWSNLPDDDWPWQDDKSWVIGEFVWTGYDYLGEPTPYKAHWPSRSSYFGICDLAGLPKDRFWLYRSHWNKEKHTVHLLPHWTWPGREGQVTPVYCYTDGEEAELFVNGKSQGRIRKNKESRIDRYRLRWNDVKYAPGKIEVVAYDANGKEIGKDVRYTAGKPARIKAQAERDTLIADGNDMAYITISLVDRKGNLIPNAADQFEFSVTGEASYQAACNGDATSLESFTQPKMCLFSGQLVVVLRTTKQEGQIQLKIRNPQRNLSTVCRLTSVSRR